MYRGIDEDIQTRSLIEVCAIQWSLCVEKAVSGLSSINDSRVLPISYEVFVCDPPGSLEKIAAFLDLDPSSYRNDQVIAGVSQANIGKGKRALNADQQVEIRSLIERTSSILEKLLVAT